MPDSFLLFTRFSLNTFSVFNLWEFNANMLCHQERSDAEERTDER